MLEIRVEHIVHSLVEMLLVGKGCEDKALHFQFDAGLSHYNESKSWSSRKGLHLLYFLPPERSYITVFSAIVESPFTKVEEITDWKHEATHDSCWRDIRAFSELYFGMAHEINSQLESEGLETVAPIRMHNNTRTCIFHPLFDWVKVKVTKDPNDQRNYRRLVEVIK